MNKKIFLFLLLLPGFVQAESKPVSIQKISTANLASSINPFILENDISKRDPAAAKKKKIKRFKFERSKQIKLPSLKNFIKKKKKPISLKEVSPPSSSKVYYPAGTDEAELENIINEEIRHLFKLIRRKRTSALDLRLGSLYVEKARLISFKLQMDHERKMQEFNQRIRKTKPYLSMRSAEVYNRKALKVFESFRNRYPKHSRSDEVLFFLGFNSYQLSKFTQGANYFRILEKLYPRSPYLYEVWFQLGEHYFNRQKWQTSFNYYKKVSRKKNGKFYFFSLYKMAWCNYKRYYVTSGLKILERIIKESRDAQKSKKASQRFTFTSEAIQDLVLFYTYSKQDPAKAKTFFHRLLDEETAWASLKKLAYAYRDTGHIKGVRALFNLLIESNPTGPEAFDYKYQIVHSAYDFGTISEIVNEFKEWVKSYGPGSPWASANSTDRRLLKKSHKLIEATLKNYALKNHQTFRISKNAKERTIALSLYKLYFDSFKTSANAAQIYFFYGELLFDARKYIQAVKAYEYVINNYPKTKYVQSSYVNQLLALEKSLPNAKELNKIIENKDGPIEFPNEVKAFIKVSLRYLDKFPKEKNAAKILYRVAIFYYNFNQNHLASKYLERLSSVYPKFKYMGNVGSLLLDIYNKNKNYKSLSELATRFANSKDVDQELLKEAQFVLEQLSFKKAQDLAINKSFKESADLYYKFAKENSSVTLAPVAYYNAAINYEKTKNIKKAIAMYSAVLTYKSIKYKKIRGKSTEFLPVLYERLGLYKKAADGYAFYARNFPKNSKAVNYWYNAGVIFDAMDDTRNASFSYTQYLNLNKQKERYEALYLLAALYERKRNWPKAVQYYKRYLNSPTFDSLNAVEASFKVAHIYEKKLRNQAQATIWHKQTLNLHKKLGAGISYGARSHFFIVKKIYLQFLAVRIPRQAHLQKSAVNKKIQLLKKLELNLRPIIRYNEGEQIIASLAIIGLANQKMAEAIYQAPIPKGLNKEGIQQYKEGIKNLVTPYIKEALKSYDLALSKSKKFKVYSEWLESIHQGLHQIDFDQEEFKGFKEAAVLPEVLPLQILDNKGIITKKMLKNMTSSLKYDVSKEDLEKIERAMKSKKETQVLTAISNVLNKDPDNVLAINSLAFFYLKRGSLKMASLIINRALAKKQNQHVLLNNLGVIALKYDQHRDAITYFKKALVKNSSYPLAQINLATVFINNYDYENAFSLYRNSHSSFIKNRSVKNKDTIHLLNNYGVSLIGAKKWKTSLSLFKRFTKMSSPRPEILMNYIIVLVNGFKDEDSKKEAKGLVEELYLYSKSKIFRKKLDKLSQTITNGL